jgi:hypothetical protein
MAMMAVMGMMVDVLMVGDGSGGVGGKTDGYDKEDAVGGNVLLDLGYKIVRLDLHQD